MFRVPVRGCWVWWVGAVTFLGAVPTSTSSSPYYDINHVDRQDASQNGGAVDSNDTIEEVQQDSTVCPRTIIEYPTKNLCRSRSLLSHIQRLQLSRARLEVGLHDVRPNASSHMGFYTYSYGETELYTGSQPLIYYRIYKNGNDMIRNILKSVSLTLRLSLWEVSPTLNVNLRDKTCRQSRTRIPFTFFRDPMSRFVSAYGEYEIYLESMCPYTHRSRLYKMCRVIHDLVHTVYVKSAVGTVDRVKEMIRMVLHYDGSSSQMIRELGYDISHFFAQVNVLLIAGTAETAPLQHYKLEQFQQDWERFANSTPIPYHLTGSVQQDISQRSNSQSWHVSQADLHQAKAAATELLLDRGRVDGEDTDGSAKGRAAEGAEVDQDERRENTAYVRAVCRLYLPDYVCLDYPLPPECQDLYDELRCDEQLYADANTVTAPSPPTLSWLLRYLDAALGSLPLCKMFPVRHWPLSMLTKGSCWGRADHMECMLGREYGFPV